MSLTEKSDIIFVIIWKNPDQSIHSFGGVWDTYEMAQQEIEREKPFYAKTLIVFGYGMVFSLILSRGKRIQI